MCQIALRDGDTGKQQAKELRDRLVEQGLGEKKESIR